MNRYTVHTPIWHGTSKVRSIGIAEFRLPCIVTIDWKNKDGDRVYPNDYIVTEEFGTQYPIKRLPTGVQLRIIPIKDLELHDEN